MCKVRRALTIIVPLSVVVLQANAADVHEHEATTRYSTQAAADSAYSDWEKGWVDLDAVVVTGTRTPKPLKDTPIQTRLITAADISKTDASNIEDLLEQEMPGVEFSQSMNQQTHMNFSGFGGQSVLFLIDGERLAGETQDDVDFTRLNMGNVERVEIVKGAASALYGSNAAGGVVNVITRQPSEKWSLHVHGRGSKHNDWRYGVSLGLNGGKVQNVLSFNSSTIDNYKLRSKENQQARVITDFYGDKTYNGQDKLIWRPTKGLKFTAKAGYYFREQVRTETVPERYRDFTGGIKCDWDITTADHLELSGNFDQYDKSDYQRLARLDVRDYSNVQNSLRALYNRHTRSGDILTLGADYLHDYLYNKNLEGQKREQDSFDIFGQYDWTLTRQWEVVGALRYDFFSDGSESRLTPKLSVRYQPLQSVNVRASYGMGFRAPSLKEKYYNFDMAGIWIIQGNPELVPEVSHNFNASVEYVRWHYNVTVSGYYNNVRNRLTTGAPYVDAKIDPSKPDQLYLSYINLRDYQTYGFDISVRAKWDNGIGAKCSYAFVHEEFPKDRDGESINNQYVPARAHTLTARVEWDRQLSGHYGLNVSVSGRALGGVDNLEFVDYRTMGDDGKLLRKKIHYAPYTLWKLSAVQRIGEAFRLTIAVDNVFNYRPDYYYLNAPLTDGIKLQVGMSMDVEKLFK